MGTKQVLCPQKYNHRTPKLDFVLVPRGNLSAEPSSFHPWQCRYHFLLFKDKLRQIKSLRFYFSKNQLELGRIQPSKQKGSLRSCIKLKTFIAGREQEIKKLLWAKRELVSVRWTPCRGWQGSSQHMASLVLTKRAWIGWAKITFLGEPKT